MFRSKINGSIYINKCNKSIGIYLNKNITNSDKKLCQKWAKLIFNLFVNLKQKIIGSLSDFFLFVF